MNHVVEHLASLGYFSYPEGFAVGATLRLSTSQRFIRPTGLLIVSRETLPENLVIYNMISKAVEETRCDL